MNRWKKLTAVAVALVVTAGAGAAWAQDGNPDNSGPTPPPATTKALGGGNREGIFQAVTPCRLVDTRNAGGKFNVGQQRTYDVRGNGPTFAAQGGQAGGCGIPNGATAVEVTVTAASATGKGFVRVFPSTVPNATFLNSTSGFDASNTGTVGLCGADGILCLQNADLRVKDFGSNTHIIIDVQGYYQQQMAAHVLDDGTLSRNSRASSAQRSGVGVYQVHFDRNVTTCAFNISNGETSTGVADGFATAQPSSGDTSSVFVRTYNGGGSASDQPFYLTVTC